MAQSQSPQILSLPPPSADQKYVTISALDGGHLTLPEYLFITDTSPTIRTTVPSLSFLIQHPSPSANSNRKTTNLVFDLGLKRDFSGYRKKQQDHAAQRQPTITNPDVADSLRNGGLDPAKDIDIVLLSHVHWDHVGTPADFPNSKFLVGSGTLHLLANGGGPLYPAELFNADELPHERTLEFPPVTDDASTAVSKDRQTEHMWQPLAQFPATLDLFNDGSVYVVDSPGHLYGHVNLLARISPTKWVYLGGDCCHDVRILTGEQGVALYDDGHGGMRSVHVDTEAAKGTIGRIGDLLGRGEMALPEGIEVEVIVAHDKGWRERNGHRFLPGML
ncbi:beta-lactamase-like protein [Leptodontidium sp. MPI-SDFR-AT-0119]|nr:beta-lactamase-like protein [Leptodontidium sp. MPI-SDFR-AT-0119]